MIEKRQNRIFVLPFLQLDSKHFIELEFRQNIENPYADGRVTTPKSCPKGIGRFLFALLSEKK